MDKLLYVAMSGAKQSMLGQNIRSNNLANANTTGFKRDFEQLRSMPVFGEHYPSRVYAMTERPGIDYSEGHMIQTGRDLDVAVKGQGFLTVLDDQGNEAFTRVGNLTTDPNGMVTTAKGYTVMGNAGPLFLPPVEKVEIAADGTISARGLGQQPNALVEVDRMKLVNPNKEQIIKGEDSLFRRKDGLIEDPDFNVRVASGYLEGSNVNAVEEMLGVVSHSRQFELQIKMMRKAEEMDEASARLLRMS